MSANAHLVFHFGGRLLLGCALAATPLAQAQVYGGLSDNGSIVLSNFRSDEARQLVIGDATALAPAATAAVAPTTDVRFSTLIRRAAEDTSLSPGLLQAVIAVESGYDARAVSPKGAQGLMQLMPATARSLGVTDPFDPGQNIAAGATHLKSLLARFDNNVELALAAYNAGADAVIRAGYRVPPFAETRAYVPRVLAHAKRLEAIGSRTDDRVASSASHLPRQTDPGGSGTACAALGNRGCW